MVIKEQKEEEITGAPLVEKPAKTENVPFARGATLKLPGLGLVSRLLTIRGRLILLNLTIVGLLLIMVTGVQYAMLHYYEQQQNDDILRGRVTGLDSPGFFRQDPSKGPPQGLPGNSGIRVAQQAGNSETNAILFDHSGSVIASYRPPPPDATDPTVTASQPPPAPMPDPALVQRVFNGTPQVCYTTRIDHGPDLRACLFPIYQPAISNHPSEPQVNPQPFTTTQFDAVVPGTIIGVLQVDRSLATSEDLVNRVVLLDGFGILVLLLLLSLLAGPLVGAALKPLQKVIAATGVIAAGNFGLRLASSQTDDEVGRLTTAFNDMAEQLDALFRTERQLVADASHELRTPVTAMRGTLEMLMIGAADSDPAMRRRLLQSCHAETLRLGRLVNELLTLNRLDRGEPIQLIAFDIRPLVEDIVAQTRILAGTRAVDYQGPEVEGPLRIRGDSDRLREVLLNIVDNAIKWSAPEGHITLALNNKGKGRPPVVEIVVQDDGAGIAQADLPHLFDRFYRADVARTRQKGGNGLGLAIARAIVSAHGGNIVAESAGEGKGSTFRIILPLLQQAEGEPINAGKHLPRR